MNKQFGSKPTAADIEQYSKSKHWIENKFVNLEKTVMQVDFYTLPKLLYKQFCEKEGREPKQKLPILPFDKGEFLQPAPRAKFLWYGHSAVLMRFNNQTIFIDPMLGKNAAPISPFGIHRFSDNTLQFIDDFPEIDLLCLTHDHYDHADYESIRNLQPKVKKYFVALGVKRHLTSWGIDENLIAEFDWWENKAFGEIRIVFTPTRHFSGRGLRDRAKSLWGGWSFTSDTENIWFSGDSGYGTHFKEIGNRLGPFDFAFMECGQYNENWRQIHMFPEESVQAAIDAKAIKIMPVHWGAFSLAQHAWTDPADRFLAECKKQNMQYVIPKLGELCSLSSELPNTIWWEYN